MVGLFFSEQFIKKTKKIILLKIKLGAVEMAQWIKALAF